MLEVSRVLFILAGAVWLLIGIATPFASETRMSQSMLIVSPRADLVLYGEASEQLLARTPALAMFRRVMMRIVAGLLVAAGILVTGLAWFGLRDPPPWVLALLTVAGLVVIPYWLIALRPYAIAGVRLSLADLPPFMWIPSILHPVAAVLGWIAIRS